MKLVTILELSINNVKSTNKIKTIDRTKEHENQKSSTVLLKHQRGLLNSTLKNKLLSEYFTASGEKTRSAKKNKLRKYC